MGDIIIEGKITTVGPLSIAMPDGNPDHDGFPVMSRGVDNDGNLLKTGYLPATTLRGFLRRAVVIRDMEKAKGEDKPYSLQRAYAELIGQDSGSEKQAGEIDLLEIREMREESPIIDLFGSGLGVKSRLRVSHFLPKANVNVMPERYSGVRKDLGDTDGAVESLSEEDAVRYRGREEANNRRADTDKLVKSIQRKIRAAERKEEDTAELRECLEEAEKNLEKYKKEMGDMQVSSRTIVGYSALAAGIDLHGRIVVLNAKCRDLPLIEFGLDRLSRDPVLGAQSARGCGEITGKFSVFVKGDEKKRITIGGYRPAKIDKF